MAAVTRGPGLLFRDITLPDGVRGWEALLTWWDKVPTVTLENTRLIAGTGWAVVRWTDRRVHSTDVEFTPDGSHP